MKSIIGILLTSLIVFVSCNTYSQNGWGRGSNYNRLYDVKTVETISGVVTDINKIYPEKNMSHGIHLTLSTANGSISIHLGPGWYIENQEVQISKDDNVTVTGSRVKYDGNDVIIAKEVAKGDQVLVLRDDEGYPLWAGWRNKR